MPTNVSVVSEIQTVGHRIELLQIDINPDLQYEKKTKNALQNVLLIENSATFFIPKKIH